MTGKGIRSEIHLPQYLDRIKPSKRYYGRIKKVGNEWVIKAEP
jgi:hypothetical protein